jgi:Glycosyltransferase like family 2
MLVKKRILGTCAYLGGVPSVGEYFCWSWSQLVAYNSAYVCGPNDQLHYDRALTSFHAAARNSLVKRMKGEFLFMLDTDHLFEPDLLARLLRILDTYAEVEVLTGVYTYKEPPYAPVLYHHTEDGRILPLGAWDQKAELLQVDGAGAGCLLVKRSVYETIVRETGEWPFDIKLGLTEDHSFFRRLKELGIPAYCAPKVECHHVRPQALGLKDYDRSRVQLGAPYTRQGAL